MAHLAIPAPGDGGDPRPMTMRKELPIERLALRFVAMADEVANCLPPLRAYLADQLRRAAASVYLNLREGLGEFSPREKARLYRLAYRSLIEALGCIGLALLFCPALVEETRLAERAGNELGPQLHRLILYQRKRPPEVVTGK